MAYFYGNIVYDFRGRQLGTINKGWIRDNNGLCAFFTENAYGGPDKPVKHIRPVKSVKHVNPIKSIRHIPCVKTGRSAWLVEYVRRTFFIGIRNAKE